MFGKQRIKRKRSGTYRNNEPNSIQDKWYEKHGTTTEIAGVIIGIVVAFFTIGLFYQTKESTKAAVQAAQDADSALQLSKRQFEQSQKDAEEAKGEQTKRSREEAKEKRSQFVLDSTSVQAQIDALRETHKNFQIENRPFVSISDVFADTSFANNACRFGWKFMNTGRFPAKVLDVTVAIGFGRDTMHIVKSNFFTIYPNAFLPYGGTIGQPIKGTVGVDFVSDSFKDSLKRGTAKVYLMGKFTYTSTALNKKYLNEFVIEITYGPTMENLAWLRNDEY